MHTPSEPCPILPGVHTCIHVFQIKNLCSFFMNQTPYFMLFWAFSFHMPLFGTFHYLLPSSEEGHRKQRKKSRLLNFYLNSFCKQITQSVVLTLCFQYTPTILGIWQAVGSLNCIQSFHLFFKSTQIFLLWFDLKNNILTFNLMYELKSRVLNHLNLCVI